MTTPDPSPTSHGEDETEETLTIVAPLENLRSDIEELELGDGLRLTRLTGIDFRHLAETYSHSPEFNDLAVRLESCTHCFQINLHGRATTCATIQLAAIEWLTA